MRDGLLVEGGFGQFVAQFRLARERGRVLLHDPAMRGQRVRALAPLTAEEEKVACQGVLESAQFGLLRILARHRCAGDEHGRGAGNQGRDETGASRVLLRKKFPVDLEERNRPPVLVGRREASAPEGLDRRGEGVFGIAKSGFLGRFTGKRRARSERRGGGGLRSRSRPDLGHEDLALGVEVRVEAVELPDLSEARAQRDGARPNLAEGIADLPIQFRQFDLVGCFRGDREGDRAWGGR